MARMPRVRFLQYNENGEVSAEQNAYGFNHAVRGYDPEEVDDYINNLFDNYKNTQNVLNKHKEEYESEKEMLECEIDDLRGKKEALETENKELKATIEELRDEILVLAEGGAVTESESEPVVVQPVQPTIVEVPVQTASADEGSAEFEVLYAENNELIEKNRNLSIENARMQKTTSLSVEEAERFKLECKQYEEKARSIEQEMQQYIEKSIEFEEKAKGMEDEIQQMRRKMEIVDSKELIDTLLTNMNSLEDVLKQRQAED